MITTSTGSPRWRRPGIEVGDVPDDGAGPIVTTVCPVARWNSGTSSRYAAEKLPETKTRISTPNAIPAKTIMLAATRATVLEAIDNVFISVLSFSVGF
jgi:hypothetical protein